MTSVVDYLATIGFDVLSPHTVPAYTDDDDMDAGAEAASVAVRADHRHVANLLRESKPVPRAGDAAGVKWLDRVITWPDRIPDLKTWAGQQTLAKLIAARQKSLGGEPIDDLFAFTAIIGGASGIDKRTRQSARDVGFSLNQAGIAVLQRPALELLAIIGLESVPLVSFAKRDCGFVHDGKVWRFPVEMADGGYLASWGAMAEYKA